MMAPGRPHTLHAEAPEPPKSYPTKEESIRDANNRAAKAEAYVKRLQERVATLEREAVTLRADIKKARLACAAMREKVAQVEDAAASAVMPPMPHVRTWKVGDVVSTPDEYAMLLDGATLWGWGGGPSDAGFNRDFFLTLRADGTLMDATGDTEEWPLDKPRVIRSLPDSPRP
jgi:hypothetical protein